MPELGKSPGIIDSCRGRGWTSPEDDLSSVAPKSPKEYKEFLPLCITAVWTVTGWSPRRTPLNGCPYRRSPMSPYLLCNRTWKKRWEQSSSSLEHIRQLADSPGLYPLRTYRVGRHCRRRSHPNMFTFSEIFLFQIGRHAANVEPNLEGS